MKKNPYRALLIWGLLVVSLITIYPTVGWMTLPSDEHFQNLTREQRLAWQSMPESEKWADSRAPKEGTREYRMEIWREQDRDPERRTAGAFREMYNAVVRWAEFDRDMVINLGLDLQGGIHMVIGFDLEGLPIAEKKALLTNYDPSLEVENMSEEALNAELPNIEETVQETILQQVRRRVNEFEAQEPIIQKLGSNQVQIQLPGEKDIERAVNLIKKTAQLNFHAVAGPDESRPIFRKIAELFPDFETYFERSGTSDLTLPSENYEAVASILAQASERGIIPADKSILFSAPPKPEEKQTYTLYCVGREPIQTGEGLRHAAAQPDESNPPYFRILFAFNNQAGAHFGEVTQANINQRMAVVVDKVVLSAPVIRDQITTSGVINGDFGAEEARDLSIALNSGSMAVPVSEEFTRVVGPSLGAESVRSGVTSAVTGMGIVCVFMLIYYMVAGAIAVCALLANAVFIIAAMAYFNLTLTLPGIAGLILTMGMAVDANVLIFERIREELKLGHALAASVQNGFNRAAVTILDANVTTLIAALVLMQFGTGPIQGFAIALSIGVVTSVFAALIVSRALFEFLLTREYLRKLNMLSFFKPNSSIPFMQGRRIGATVSIVAIVLSMTLFVYRGQANFGVDFTAGTNLELTIDADENVPVDDVRHALDGAGFVSPVVQEVGAAGDRNHFLIRVGDRPANGTQVSEAGGFFAPKIAYAQTTADAEPPVAAESAEAPAGALENSPALDAETAPPSDGAVDVGAQVREALSSLTSSGSIDGVDLIGEQDVGPAVGQQLRIDALKAIAASIVFIIIYLWFRFELRFAVGAVVALLHDVTITLGLFALTGREINMPVVAAILTIIGYSLNDTIVVFDRIREDMQLNRGKGLKLLDVMNLSINETLGRTLLTSLTTFFVVVILFIFGGAALKDFAFALIVGIAVGTYSSIFVASPVVYIWQRLRGRHELPTDTGEGKGGKGKGGKSKKRSRKGNAGEATA
ncbi:protein translocase subunit SecD [Roseovarius pacificus]|uniref:protein translocase subunit SecD n=1 Tax=Roseovarius pacificus TaxID=337701 RepID=UPI002A18DDD0|nr:protein translocase subunit SecD [Roseovarius pacificus]